MYKVITGPASIAIDVQEAKNHLKVDTNADDQLIESLIRTATEVVEHDTGRCLLSQTIRENWDCLPCGRVIELSLSPLSSVTHVKYLNDGGTLTTFDSANYTVDSDSEPPRIVLNPNTSWPNLGSYPNALQVTYVAGSSTVADVPYQAKQAILLQVAYMYEKREDSMIQDNRVRSSEWLTRKLRVHNI